MTVRVIRSKFTVGVLAALSTFIIAGPASAQAIPQKNVNVIGPTPVNWLLAGNPRMQQNEPECAVSPGNTHWQFCGFNDYRAVNDPTIADAFPGVAMSRDGGRTWISGLHPRHLGDMPTLNQKFGADANIEALPNLLLYNFIAGWRDDTRPGGVYVSRWYEHNREVGPPWEFLDVIEVDVGTSGKFLDKPAFDVALYDLSLGRAPIEIQIPAYEDPRNPANSHEMYTLSVPAARAHLCYSVFVGNDNNNGTKITCVASDDGGQTWPTRTKITESVEINQGASVATRNGGQDALVVWRRFDDNNETGAIMFATSTNWGNTWSKGEVLTEICAFDQTTGPARFRTNALPVAVSNGTDFSVYFAARNNATETCFEPPKGNGKNKQATPRMSDVGEGFDFDGPENGEVRTALNFSRIMMVRGTGSGTLTWTTPEMVDPQLIDPDSVDPDGPRKPFHQFMPAAEVAAGIETISWFDSRMDKLNLLRNPIVGGFVEDYVLHLETNTGGGSAGTLLPSGIYEVVPPPPELPPAVNNFPLRRNIDMFAAQLVDGSVRPYTVDAEFYPDTAGTESNSVRVSRFATRAKPGGVAGERQQLEYNYANGRLFRKGRAPFIGDYNTVFSPQYRQLQTGEWVSNQNPLNLSSSSTELFSSSEPVFNVGWTSNHQVRGRVFYTGCDVWDETLQMWVASPDGCASTYQDPSAMPAAAMAPLTGEDGSTDGPPGVCHAVAPGQLKPQPLTRNQNIYVAAMKPGINVNVASAIKFPDGIGFNTFVLQIQNGTGENRRVRLELPLADPAVSFDKDSPLKNIEVSVKRGSGNVRTVFDVANILDAPDDVVVEVFDVTGLDSTLSSLRGEGNLVARVALIRNSLVPLENVQNNDPDDLRDIIDPDGEFYDIILKREIGVRRLLDLENLDLENLDLENSIFLLDLENLDLENLDLENLDLENLDLENAVLFLDLENLDLENVDLSNLDLENALYEQLDLENLDLENLDLENLDLENLDLENRNLFYLDLENLDLENTVFEQLDLENLDLENLDLENLDLENLDLENFSIYASDVENLDLENLDLENTAPGDEYVEISWTADSGTNTTTGVDIKPLFSPNLAGAIDESGTKVLLTVRQPYLTGTVVTNQAGAAPGIFCTPQVVAENQVVFAAILDPSQINDLIADPDPTNPDTPSFLIDPDGSKIITMRFINPPPGFDIESLSRNTGVALYTQPGAEQTCDAELGGTEVFNVCEIDYIADNEPPLITLIGEATVTVDAAGPPSVYSDEGATAFDENDGDVTVTTSHSVDLAALGTYTVTYTATDASGNSATAERTVIVADLTAPTITAPANILLEATGATTVVGIGTATAYDFVGPVTISNDSPGAFPLGETTVTWTATDGVPFMTTATQTVTLVDTMPPVLNLLGDNPLELQATAVAYVDAGATAIDAVFGMLLPAITFNDVDPSTVGTYSITYTATDGSVPPNSATATRVVTVVDTTDPVIVITDPPDFEPDAPFVLAPGETTFSIDWPVSAQDLESGLSLSCTIDGVEFDPESTSYADGALTAIFNYEFSAGTTSVTCTVTDQGGNTATSDPFNVLVEDVPVITALEGTLVVPADSGSTASVSNAQLAANISVTDLVDDDLSGAVTCLDTDPSDFTIGEHTIECSVTDSGGNEASTTFQLEVVFPYDVVILPLKGNIKAGSTAPLDWYYVETGTTNKVASGAIDPTVAWFGPFSERTCTEGSDGSGDGAEDSGSSSIRYSPSDDTWRLNWQTPNQPNWYNVVVSPPGTAASSTCVRLRK